MSKQEIEKAVANLIQEEDLPTPDEGDWGQPELEPEPETRQTRFTASWEAEAIDALRMIRSAEDAPLPTGAQERAFIQTVREAYTEIIRDDPGEFVDNYLEGMPAGDFAEIFGETILDDIDNE